MGAQCCKNWCGAVYDEEVVSTANATFKEYCQPGRNHLEARDVDIAARRVLIRVGGILKNVHPIQLVQAHKQVAGADDPMDIHQFKQLISRLVFVAKANQHDKYYGTTFMAVPGPRPPRPWFGSTARPRYYRRYYHQQPGGAMVTTTLNSDGLWWGSGTISGTSCWYDTQCQADSGGGSWGGDGGGCSWAGDSGGWGGGGYDGGGCSGGDGDGGGGGCDSGGCSGGGCDSGGCGGS